VKPQEVDLYLISNTIPTFRRPPGRLNGVVWGGGRPPRNQVKFRLLAAPGQYMDVGDGLADEAIGLCRSDFENAGLVARHTFRGLKSYAHFSLCKPFNMKRNNKCI
jgi:hypothetical protein